jgi:hypothetical protein
MKIIIYQKSEYFSYYAKQLKRGFEKLQLQAEIRSIFGGKSEYNPAVAHLIIGVHEFVPELKYSYSKRIYGIQTEHLPNASNFALSRSNYNFEQIHSVNAKFAHIFDWIPSNVAHTKLKNHSYIPHGVLDLPKRKKHKHTSTKPVLAFTGTLNNRRNMLIDKICNYAKVEILNSKFGYDRLMQEQKFDAILNIHIDESPVFEAPRFWEALSIGMPIITEYCDDTKPFSTGDHLITAVFNDRKSLLYSLNKVDEIKRRIEDTQDRHKYTNMVFVASQLINRILAEETLLKSRKYRLHRQLQSRLGGFGTLYRSIS